VKGKYRVYVIGDTPNDLRARIAEIHAWAILKSKSEDPPTKIRSQNPKIQKGDD
jgi:hypothetical protein